MMNNAQLAAASMDDIVFDGRNKGYGAYELRALYQRNVSRALAIGTTVFALLVMFPVVAKYFEDPAPVITHQPTVTNELIDINVDDIPVTPPAAAMPPPPPPPPTAQTRYVTFKVDRDDKVTETPPNMDELKDTPVGPTTVDGPKPTAPVLEPERVDPPAIVADVAPTAEIYRYVEQMPELPGGGGVAAIVAAIQKAARYPSTAMREGIEGKVYVSFTVNSKGEVVDVKMVKGLGYGLDEEAMRAIKTLPRFIPGKQNGREVSVAYTVPVTFKIQ